MMDKETDVMCKCGHSIEFDHYHLNAMACCICSCAKATCSNCGRPGPIPHRTQPHMGMCGTCGRIPNAS